MLLISNFKTLGERLLGKDYQKGAVLVWLVLTCVGLTYYSHWVLRSQPGVGTTFYVYLPIVKSVSEGRAETADPVPGGTESILFVGDEAVVVKMGRETLERFGYRVTTRTSSVDALELFRVKPGKFDLVITDQTMPNMTGAELAPELLRIRPDIPVILCTGFSHVITPDKARALGIREFVMKPIVGAELGRTVRRVLDGVDLKLETRN